MGVLQSHLLEQPWVNMPILVSSLVWLFVHHGTLLPAEGVLL